MGVKLENTDKFKPRPFYLQYPTDKLKIETKITGNYEATMNVAGFHISTNVKRQSSINFST
jgi:hypothetical protein